MASIARHAQISSRFAQSDRARITRSHSGHAYAQVDRSPAATGVFAPSIIIGATRRIAVDFPVGRVGQAGPCPALSAPLASVSVPMGKGWAGPSRQRVWLVLWETCSGKPARHWDQSVDLGGPSRRIVLVSEARVCRSCTLFGTSFRQEAVAKKLSPRSSHHEVPVRSILHRFCSQPVGWTEPAVRQSRHRDRVANRFLSGDVQRCPTGVRIGPSRRPPAGGARRQGEGRIPPRDCHADRSRH